MAKDTILHPILTHGKTTLPTAPLPGVLEQSCKSIKHQSQESINQVTQSAIEAQRQSQRQGTVPVGEKLFSFSS